MSVYTMLTTPGLNEINSASPLGIRLEVAYWVTAYDKRIADQYDIDPSVITIGDYTTSTDTYPNEGITPSGTAPGASQIFWQTSAGPSNPSTPDIADIYSGVTYQSVVDTTSAESKGDWTTAMYSNPPISDTGDWWTVIDAGSIDGTDFIVDDIIAYNGALFIKGVDGLNNPSRANFKLEIQDSEQTFYVNKIGVYAIKRNISGTTIGDPFLLGQVIIPETQLIKPFDEASFSVDMLTVDFQIDTQAVLTDFDDIIFSSENDYWQQVVPNNGQSGLLYDGSVYITNTLGIRDSSAGIPSTEDVGVAKLLISTFKTVNKPNSDEEEDLPQLALQYTDIDAFQGGTGFDARIRTTLRTNPDGNCEFNFYGACNTDYDYYALIPKHDTIFGIGNNDNRWRVLKTSNRIELYLGAEYDTGSDGRWDYIHEADTPGYMVLRNNDLSYNVFSGLAHFGNTSIEVGPHHDYREVGDFSLKPNYFYAKGNISNYIAVIKETEEDDNSTSVSYPLAIRSTEDMFLYTISSDTISKQEIDGFGETNWDLEPVEVKRQIEKFIEIGTDVTLEGFSSAIIADDTIFGKFFSYNDWGTIQSGIGGGFIETINEMRTALYGSVEPIGYTDDGNGIKKDVMIASSRYIYTNGDILCMVDGLNNIGAYGHEYRRIYTGGLVGNFNDADTGGFTGNRYINVEGDLFPDDRGSVDGFIIGRSATGVRWKEINADNIGADADRIDNGYFGAIKITNTLQANRVVVDTRLEVANAMYMNSLGIFSNSDGTIDIGTEGNRIRTVWAYNIETVGGILTYRDRYWAFNDSDSNTSAGYSISDRFRQDTNNSVDIDLLFRKNTETNELFLEVTFIPISKNNEPDYGTKAQKDQNPKRVSFSAFSNIDISSYVTSKFGSGASIDFLDERNDDRNPFRWQESTEHGNETGRGDDSFNVSVTRSGMAFSLGVGSERGSSDNTVGSNNFIGIRGNRTYNYKITGATTEFDGWE